MESIVGFLAWLRAMRNGYKGNSRIAEYEKLYRTEEPIERPEPLPVEESFDAFVKEFGGEKISDRIEKKDQMPLNADYIFADHNVIAELKTLEGVFAGSDATASLFQAFSDTGHTGKEMMDVVFRGKPIPDSVQSVVRTRIRRRLEDRVKAARKQLKRSKDMFGNAETFTLILFAMDQTPLLGHGNMLFHLAKLMSENYADTHPDGFVYLNPNTPTKVVADGMEFAGWYPLYRDEEVNESLRTFVNLLGNGWLTYSARINGNPNPILQMDDYGDETMSILR